MRGAKKHLNVERGDAGLWPRLARNGQPAGCWGSAGGCGLFESVPESSAGSCFPNHPVALG